MVNEYGSKPVSEPEKNSESLYSDSDTTSRAGSVLLSLGSSDVSLDEMIQMHLVDCDQCRHAVINDRPKGIGQRSTHCNTYWELHLMRAKAEGAANNIVAYTEFGDEAAKGRPLE